MTATFVDTSFLIALLLSDDSLHDRALAWKRHMGGDLVTTEYVLVELCDALAGERLRPIPPKAIAALRSDPAVFIVPSTTQLLDKGLSLFQDRKDKTWGLTDCISFVVMREAGMREALTADQHFVQAGFDALLRRLP